MILNKYFIMIPAMAGSFLVEAANYVRRDLTHEQIKEIQRLSNECKVCDAYEAIDKITLDKKSITNAGDALKKSRELFSKQKITDPQISNNLNLLILNANNQFIEAIKNVAKKMKLLKASNSEKMQFDNDETPSTEKLDHITALSQNNTRTQPHTKPPLSQKAGSLY